jgi:hypothetical protein
MCQTVSRLVRLNHISVGSAVVLAWDFLVAYKLLRRVPLIIVDLYEFWFDSQSIHMSIFLAVH